MKELSAFNHDNLIDSLWDCAYLGVSTETLDIPYYGIGEYLADIFHPIKSKVSEIMCEMS